MKYLTRFYLSVRFQVEFLALFYCSSKNIQKVFLTKIHNKFSNRSYHISSKKFKDEVGFETTHTIQDAVQDLCAAFEKGLLPNSLDNEMYFNIKRMQNLELI